jgi:DnaJ like chaperone protein
MKWLLAALALIYALVPFDVLPDVLTGLGWLDDLLLAGLVWYFFFRRVEAPQERTGASTHGGSKSARQESRQKAADATDGDDAAGDPYRILELQPGASPAEIRAAYRRLATRYHPDKVAHLGKEFQNMAEMKFKAIQEAYNTLQQQR